MFPHQGNDFFAFIIAKSSFMHHFFANCDSFLLKQDGRIFYFLSHNSHEDGDAFLKRFYFDQK